TPTTNPIISLKNSGYVGIGTNNPLAKLYADGGDSDPAVFGNSSRSYGVIGKSSSLYGVSGISDSGICVVCVNSPKHPAYLNGNVHVTGTLSQGSDARLKEGISNLSYGLREVMRLRPVTWTWKKKPEQGPQVGLIAQEVESVLPELVSTDKDAEHTKGLNYIG